MATLSTELRNQLTRVISTARREAEAGARRALEVLAVDRHEPHGPMTPEERELRNRLRAHGRQLGDVRDRAQGTQEIGRLVHEVAYEHWHRMLFARFLAENQLLIEADSGVAISLAECEELAREKGEDPWALAARFAQRMLPRIFRPEDPALEVALAPETRQALERLVASLPTAVFTATDSLGWTYQFWQAEKKDEVNARGGKIGADELPAVTQLFTEHYMVLFLLHNTIGAWHAGKVLSARSELCHGASNEETLRQAVRIAVQDGYELSYLRFVRRAQDGDEEEKPSGPWWPAAGVFDAWPRTAAELRVLDPCCGSGHFLVEAFELLVRLRMEEESLPLEAAIRAVLADNLFGLEIDARCTQIAAFNLALSAWKLVGKPVELPSLHIACSGLAVGTAKNEWIALADDDEKLRNGMARLFDLFEKAPGVGSLVDPRSTGGDLLLADFEALEPVLARALEHERDGAERVECAVAAQGMARAAVLLAGHYTLVTTNVPYLGLRKMDASLKGFCERYYPDARHDLANVMLDRLVGLTAVGGTLSLVSPQAWLFASSFGAFRERWLRSTTWNFVGRLGAGAFDGISGEVVNVALFVVTNTSPGDGTFAGLDCESSRGANQKADQLVALDVQVASQADQLSHPDQRILFAKQAKVPLLQQLAVSLAGMQNGDSPMYQRRIWEVVLPSERWVMQQTVAKETCHFSGFDSVVDFDRQEGHLRAPAAWRREALHDSDQRGKPIWGRPGVLVSRMSALPSTLYLGDPFDQASAAIVPHEQSHVCAVWAFCSSPDFGSAVRRIDKKLNVTSATLAKVPFDLAHWQKLAAERYPKGLPAPYSEDPTQWLFHGHPAREDPARVLQVGVARLLGYRWPAEVDGQVHVAPETRMWAERCKELLPHVDGDGVVPLSALRGEVAAADRLRRLLAAAFGADWSAAKERELLAVASRNGGSAASLEEWLRERFFEEHCKLFHQRPFVWHIWDGRKDGFHALVNYHRLVSPNGEGRRTLEALTFSYLGDWIERQKSEQREGKEGADARLAAALDLQAQLERVLAGEPPCDLFVRWKSLHRQPIGWDPDINDGVRLNIRPFLSTELHTGGRKAAGILRWKPNIKWEKDRGKEPQSLRPKREYPWFWGCRGDGSHQERTDFMGGREFDGNRWNDLHYTNAAKRAARELAAGGARA